jgi:hypothetical protein
MDSPQSRPGTRSLPDPCTPALSRSPGKNIDHVCNFLQLSQQSNATITGVTPNIVIYFLLKLLIVT